MFGIYRLILACLVALSHFGFTIADFNPGQWAVLSFYVVSGFLMEKQFHKLGSPRLFYLDRLFRIYPLFILILTGSYFIFHPSSWTWFLNTLLFPLNYGALGGPSALIGPTWSLACEAHFYVLLPLLATASTKTLRILLGASIAIFAISPVLPFSTFWAYIGLPGVLFAFLSGMFIARKDFPALKISWCCFFGLFFLFSYSKIAHWGLPTGIHINVCIGYLAALLLVWNLAKYSPRHRWDQIPGLLSYPLFLIHEPLQVIIRRFIPHPSMIFLLLAAIVAAAVMTLLVEKPLDSIRYRIRKKSSFLLRK